MSIERARVIKATPGAAPSHTSDTVAQDSAVAARLAVATRMPAVVVDAHAEAARIVAEARTKAEAILAEAKESARATAEQVARDARETELARLAAEVIGVRAGAERRMERELDRTIELAVLLAERLVGEAIAVEPARVGALAEGALRETRGARQLRVEACPDDVPTLTDLLSALGEGVADEGRRRGESGALTRVAGRPHRARSGRRPARASALSTGGGAARSATWLWEPPATRQHSRMTEAAVESSPPSAKPAAWRTNLLLFLATVASVFVTGVYSQAGAGGYFARDALVHGGQFAATVLVILVAHEMGHYVAARIHKVDASLPYFIPLPIASPFGTMGAVIRMRGIIPTRRALLDIGASGPIAGLCFAIPLYIWGASHSQIVPITAPGEGAIQLGESVLMKVLDHLFAPAKPEGMDLALSPIAYGAWGGMFVTMINLLPVGQLDGGHVAYALFGPKQDRYAQFIHRSMLAFFFVVVFGHIARDVSGGFGIYYLGRHLANSLFWLVWFQVLAVLGLLSSRGRGDEPAPEALTIRVRLVALLGLFAIATIARDNHSPLLPLAFFAGLGMLVAMEVKGGVLRRHDLLDHPATGAAPLDRARKVVAVLTLVVFALLFMPEPFTM